MSSQLSVEEPFQAQVITVDGLRLFTRVAVPRPDALPLVLVHGVGVSGRYLVPLARELAPDYRVFLPDLPGHGHSSKPNTVPDLPEMADILAHWMSAMGLKQAILVGNSFGCQIIAELALRHPHCIQAAVLIGPTVNRQERNLPTQIAQFFLSAPSENPSLTFVLLQDYLRAGLGRCLQTIQIALADQPETKMPHLTMPVLIMRGTGDKMVPQDWAEELVSLLPCGQLVTLPGAGHTPHYSQPQQLMPSIQSFLHGVTAASPCFPPSVSL